MTIDAVVVLAAGEGTRMRSTLPKVLHTACGRTLLGHVLTAIDGLATELAVVVGVGADQVAAEAHRYAPHAAIVHQREQRGTGHAVRVALEALPHVTGRVLVTYGDLPLLTRTTLDRLAKTDTDAMLTALVPDATGYGRIVRDGDTLTVIVEEADATAEQRVIDEVNAGVYLLDATALRAALGSLLTGNAQAEEYLTDAVAGLGRPVTLVRLDDDREATGVNDRAQLAAAATVVRDRLVTAAMRSGVTVTDPATTWIDVGVTLEADCTIEPFTRIRGASTVRAGAVVGPYSEVVDSEIGEDACVGPFAYLRPGTSLARGAKVGAYVETKNATIGVGSKVPHLSYVGDATIGEGSNIGAATVFVNYDGRDKHHTTVGDDVRIGSDTMLVAPVTIGDGAVTAAGSVITRDVPPGALGVGRASQRNIEGWAERRRKDSPPTDDDGGATQ